MYVWCGGRAFTYSRCHFVLLCHSINFTVTIECRILTLFFYSQGNIRQILIAPQIWTKIYFYTLQNTRDIVPRFKIIKRPLDSGLCAHVSVCARVSVCMCLFVCLSVKRDLRNRSMNHYDILGDVRAKKYKNCHMPVFWKNSLFSRKLPICCKKNTLQ